MYKYYDAAALAGLTIAHIERRTTGGDQIAFDTTDGRKWVMLHEQDCCELVFINDIVGDIKGLVGSPLIVAREDITNEWPQDVPKPEYCDESFTCTAYTFETASAKVRIRWFGMSNGCYSESVQIGERMDELATAP